MIPKVDATYIDSEGRLHHSPPETVAAINELLRQTDPAPGAENRFKTAQRGDKVALRTVEIVTEDKRTLLAPNGHLPADCPFGYHQAEIDGVVHNIAVSPGECYLPTDLHTWAMAVQLYATRSERSWGIGDFADLRTAAAWAHRHHGGSVLVSPLHAPAPTLPQERSPYFPSSRRFRNPIYIDVESLLANSGQPAADGHGIDALAAQARATNQHTTIAHDEVFRCKIAVLEKLSGGVRALSPAIKQFATYCALAEKYGSDYRRWPAQLQNSQSSAVQDFGGTHQQRIAFFAWLQEVAEQQLQGVGKNFSLIQDLAVGVDPGGADVWTQPQLYARSFRVGAPPDTFNTQGQNWTQPPLLPELTLAAAEQLIACLRSVFFAGNGVRIDHIMGFFRLFWIPEGAEPSMGAYVRYPYRQLLDIIALESHRAQAWVIGEDLGTVEPLVRQEMAKRNILSYRLALFESVPPAQFPELSLAAVSTHDLPTLAGLWSGEDLQEQQRFDLRPNIGANLAMREQIQSLSACDSEAKTSEVISRTYAQLAQSPSLIVAVTLEDMAQAQRRPNLPGTTPAERDNWSIPLPDKLESILEGDLSTQLGNVLGDRRQAPLPSRTISSR